MPTNKNALIRYQILDSLLQKRQDPVPVKKMHDALNDKLKDMGLAEVGLRTMQKDLKFMRESDPWFAPIIQLEKVDDDPDHGTKKISWAYCYDEPGFSIFHRDLTDDEKQLLRASLAMLGQFDGIPELDGLKRLVDGVNRIEHNKIVYVDSNPEDHTSLLGELYLAIADKSSINLKYHTYQAPDESKTIGFHPYLLKQYNNRWYLVGASAADGKILTFCLDRVDEVKRTANLKYVRPGEDLLERYDDIIGVTYYDEEPTIKIVFWVSDKSKDYVKSKPLHNSQTALRGTEAEWRAKYPMLHGGAFFTIKVKYNYELIRELCSFGPELVVLSPERITDEIDNRLKSMLDAYRSTRT